MVTTKIVATHLEEAFEAIKGFGKAVYNSLDSGLELTEGVGLALCKAAIKTYVGAIIVESDGESAGTRLKFVL